MVGEEHCRGLHLLRPRSMEKHAMVGEERCRGLHLLRPRAFMYDALSEMYCLQGQSYEQADDSAMVMLRFKNGAQGLVHASAIAYERTYEDNGYGFDQVHEWDFHGSNGTLRQVIDWDFRQRIRAVANGQAMVPNFGDGARVQQLLDAAIESAETGCWVKTAPRSS